MAANQLSPFQRRLLSHERTIWAIALLAGFPGTVLAVVFLWRQATESGTRWLGGLALVGFWLALAGVARRRVAYPLQTLANLLEALREGDFSLRARRGGDEDALGEVMREVNLLGR